VGDDMHQRHLAEADRYIARSLELIAKQQAFVERLENSGCDSFEARRLLFLFEETLRLMRQHREMILRALRYL
jgi:hypothetical protein